MRLARRIAVAALVAASIIGVSPAAEATGNRPKVSTDQVIPVVFIDRANPTKAYVTALYRCTGEGTLWVSVKQTADRKADPRLAEEGSSQISAAWSDSHRDPVDCDGRFHVTTFVVDQLERQSPSGPLARGKAWVQFCLFDDTTGETDPPISSMVFAAVF
jgi:hypothetical protein